MKFKNILLYGTVSLVLGFSGCSNFLDVKPLDNIMEDQLFNSVKGFNTAINGVYIELNTPNVYGENLSVGLVDVMAQYYNVTSAGEHNFRYYNTYDYGNSSYKAKTEAIWQKSFSLISNLNAVVEQSEKQKSMLGDTYYGIYRGEALAMRAFLHFDLLRLFGSTYKEDLHTAVMPYVTNTDRKVQPLATNQEMVDYILGDLLAAKTLLEKVDPILTQGVLNVDGVDNNYLTYRQYRMNYFAVCGLLARVYLWRGDRINAHKYALEVIDLGQKSGSEIFPFVIPAAIFNRPGYPDRVFSTEVLFALYNDGRTNVYNKLFNYTLNSSTILTFTGALSSPTGRVKQLYPDENDYRYKEHWKEETVSNTKVLYFSKFANVTDNNGVSNSYRYMMPLMRISEMYLIASETALTLTEGTKYYNKIQVNRGLPEVSFAGVEELSAALQNEYLREFIGEGQSYFYFKRLQRSAIPSPVRPGIDVVKMDKVHYMMPLPDSETSQRN
ncbi:RagB/SusD family nutrient uptake outer membrane protein [Sphingobacterium faecale]|uniref:RagB/SusD family nutrient uptake outer membrane protein n=1 Tax=Sphingobacterium faecale TaxID=2803775 RepID=A0ABS1R440_9SPHI|nr:RagB/SusD family nutrient uptake outer membrane protein [Sphingobacterium faecale]MBL1409474.1 RagB/SusD family nutrient uptake outer membrane protein [Sphingobacterium faecale]